MKPRADEIATDTGAFATNQFGNPDVLRATGHWPTNFSRNCQDRLQSTFGSFVGSADCFVGTTCERVREVPDLWRVVVEPAESAVLSGDQQAHTTSRVVAGYRPPLLGADDYDGVMAVSEAEAFTMASSCQRAMLT